MAILGITDIGINLPLLVGQLINFTLLLIILRLFVYKPVLRMLDERRERIRAGLSAAEQGREREVEANRLAQEQLERARREIQLERDGAIAQLRQEFADLTISAAEKVIGQSLDRAAHRRLIEQALAESSFREN